MGVPPRIMSAVAWQDAHPQLVDVVIAVLVALISIPLSLLPLLSPPPGTATGCWVPTAAAVYVVMVLALALRRRYPVQVWVLVTLLLPASVLGEGHNLVHNEVQANYVFSSLTVLLLVAIPLTIGTLAANREIRLCVIAYVVTTAAQTATEALLFTVSGWDDFLSALLPFLVFNLLGLVIGLVLRIQRQNLAEVESRSARAALASEQQALLAAATERSRIAREMHDVIAHSLAVMITMADGAAATVDRNPQMAKEALKVLAETGRSALADTRRLVGVLREDPGASSAPASAADGGAGDVVGATGAGAAATPRIAALATPTAGSRATGTHNPQVRDLPVPEFAPPGTVVPVEPSARIADLRAAATAGADVSTGSTPTAPAPESADLEVLVQRFQTAGVPVTYTWNGAPLPDDKGLQLTLFRIAQESLTNVLRYAPTTKRVEVQVDRHTGTAVLVVRNDAAPGSTAMHGSGKGLIGMRERAAVYGGQVQAGPTPQGWQVKAILRWDETDEGSSSWQMPV